MKNLYLCFLAALMAGLDGNAQCITNADFENGIGGLSSSYTFTAFTSNLIFSNVDCHIDTNTSDYDPITASTALNDFGSLASLVSNTSIAPFGIYDPSLFSLGAYLPRVQPNGVGGNFAIKLNFDDNQSRDVVTMNSNFTATSSVINFDFALIFRLHGAEPDIEPFFTARIYDANGVIINTNEICYKANINSNIFNRVSDYLFTDWECATLMIPEKYIGTPVRLEFVIADCGQGGHFGSVYLDNIRCNANCTPAFGLLTLDEFSISCPKEPFNVCGDFTAPLNSTIVPGSLTLEIFDQNDNFIRTVPSVPVITGNTFCFLVNPSELSSLVGSFEFKVKATFVDSSFTYHLFDTSSSSGPDLRFEIVNSQDSYVVGYELFWPDVADSYELQFVSDGNCSEVPNHNDGYYFSTIVTQNHYDLYQASAGLISKTFRWRIKTSCGGWSEWCCLAHQEALITPIEEDFGNIYAPNCYNGDLGCLATLYADVNVMANTYFFEQREESIIAVNTIENQSRAVYQAGRFIKLQPGFQAKNGSVFLAEIETCSSAQSVALEPKSNKVFAMEKSDKQYQYIKPQVDNFTVYPNPTNGLVTITGKTTGVFTVTDITGKELLRLENKDSAEQTKVDLTSFNSGIYFLNVNGKLVQKIIKQ
ncbi:T9SS type A sorting domain-containing protein [Flavobacterium cerinum]|uniref:T9SS type A sorting domain-containing protein n=1 Tax=Flavobacterium cerinum TaxID=2502784 RepID=A0A3S4T2L9_9FLAO|nr:T9SS type A sorting domain-containing protein [Flavobacterium cerinum]RWX01665.1 T9SS type A sorting domain-containing protein [Flavobacterium cerinum]